MAVVGNATGYAPPPPAARFGIGAGLPPITAAGPRLAKAAKALQTPSAAAATHQAVRHAVGRMPVPSSDPYAAARGVVQSEVSPLISQLIGNYTRQGAAGAAAIKAVTDQYARELGLIAPQVQGDYAGAEQGTAATDAALANYVHGGGATDANALASRLASIAEPGAVNPVVAQLGQQATGAGGAVLGTGSASLDALLAGGAAQEAQALQLPGTAKEAGLQQLSGYQGQLTSAEGKDLATLAGKVPGLIQSAAGSIISSRDKAAAVRAADARNTATIKAAGARNTATITGENARAAEAAQTSRTKTLIATILATNIDPVTGLLTPQGVNALRRIGVTATPGSVAGTAGAGIVKSNTTTAARTAHDAVLENQGWARIQIAQQNADTSAGRLNLSKAKQAAAAGKSSGAMTEHEIGTMVKGWHDGSIKDVRIPAINPQTGKQATNINGVPQYSTVTKTQGQVGYIQAIQGLVGLGVPLAKATQSVNGIYGNQMLPAVQEFAQTAARQGMSPQAALQLARSQGVFPDQALVAALQGAYGAFAAGGKGFNAASSQVLGALGG